MLWSLPHRGPRAGSPEPPSPGADWGPPPPGYSQRGKIAAGIQGCPEPPACCLPGHSPVCCPCRAGDSRRSCAPTHAATQGPGSSVGDRTHFQSNPHLMLRGTQCCRPPQPPPGCAAPRAGPRSPRTLLVLSCPRFYSPNQSWPPNRARPRHAGWEQTEVVDRRQAAKPDAAGWDGTSPRGLPVAKRGKSPLPSTAPRPLRGGEGARGWLSTETPGQMGTLQDRHPSRPGRVALAGGTQPSPGGWMDAAPRTSGGGGLGAPLHPSAERVQLPARRSWEPFPQAHCRHLPGGAAHAGRGHFQPNVLLCFLHGKKLFPLLSGKLLAIIRQAGGKDSYPSNNAI